MNSLFIDFQKAFDSIYLNSLWDALLKQEISSKIVNIIKETHRNAVGRVCLDNFGPYFEISRGVKQGDPLSPNLFNCLLEDIFQKMNWEGKVIKINDEFLNNLRFADDVILISQDGEELQEMANDLARESKMVGLSINTGKTVLLSNQKENPVIQIGKEKILAEDSTVYLGQLISFDNNLNKEIARRRSNA